MNKPKPTNKVNPATQSNKVNAPQASPNKNVATSSETSAMPAKWWRQGNTLLGLGAILLLTVLVYWRALGNDFINWDDPNYVYESELVTSLSPSNIVRMFTEYAISNYHPLAILSLAIDYAWSGLNPFGYHLSNVILHLINVVLSFLFARRLALDYWANKAQTLDNNAPNAAATDGLNEKRSNLIGLVIAGFFALHPLHVESVAWISERKDMLYVLFMLPAFIAYMNYRKTGSKAQYAATFVLFLLSLLSKPSAVVFPMLLLCIDYLHYRQWHINWIVEKIPFFVLSLLFGYLTVNAQVDTAIGEFAQYTILQRICFASYGFVTYLIKLVFPINQSLLYPYPILSSGLPIQFMLAPFLAIGIVATTLWSVRFSRVLAFGILFYFFNIALVLQFMSVGEAIMSERYTYLSYTGILFVIAMLYDYLIQKDSSYKIAMGGILAVALLAFAYKSYDRLAVWKNSDLIWTNVIDQYPNRIPTAHNNRGHYRRQHGKMQEALQDLSMAIQLHPKYHLAYVNRGNTYFSLNKNDEALADYNKANEIKPDYAESYGNRGSVYFQKQQYDLAMADYNKAIELKKYYPDAYLNRAVTYSVLNKHDLAKADYDQYMTMVDDNAKAWHWRGLACRHLKMIPQSISDFDRAIQLDPKNGEFYLNRSYSHKDLGNNSAAKADALKAQSLGQKIDPAYLHSLQ